MTALAATWALRIAVASAVLGSALAPAAKAATTPRFTGNFVVATGSYFADSIRFEILPRDQPPVCSMSFDGVTLAAAPWTFGFNRSRSSLAPKDQFVHITMCSGIEQDVSVSSDLQPFRLLTRSVSAGISDAVVRLANQTDSRTTILIKDPSGLTVSQEIVSTGKQAALHLDLSAVTAPSIYSIHAVSDSGIQDTMLLPVTTGTPTKSNWSIAHAPCSTISWALDSSTQPGWASTFRSDIRTALELIAQHSGLGFLEVSDFASADVKFSFGEIGDPKESLALGAALGRGRISFAKNWSYFNESLRGFAASVVNTRTGKPSMAGRGWIIVHEVLHELGFGHSADPGSAMFPTVGHTSGLTQADLDGLHVFYRDRCATAAVN